MKNHINKSLVMALICLAGFGKAAQSQSVYAIKDTDDIDIKLQGTSTLHKWEMDARTVEGTAQFGFKPGEENNLTSLKSLFFALEVNDLKSDSKGLDKNAYKALKSDEFKDIHYKLTSATVLPVKGNRYLLKTLGKLTIAGVTREIAMDVSCEVNADGTITCMGSDKLNMTDYNVKPPTFMLGAMKTGDEITLDFTLIYKKQKGA